MWFGGKWNFKVKKNYSNVKIGDYKEFIEQWLTLELLFGISLVFSFDSSPFWFLHCYWTARHSYFESFLTINQQGTYRPETGIKRKTWLGRKEMATALLMMRCSIKEECQSEDQTTGSGYRKNTSFQTWMDQLIGTMYFLNQEFKKRTSAYLNMIWRILNRS